MPLLVYEDPKTGQEKSYEFSGNQAVVTLGRNQGNDLRLESASISRQHARIELASGVTTIVDQGSSNGTHVNGNKVIKTILTHGDMIRLGEIELQYFHHPPENHFSGVGGGHDDSRNDDTQNSVMQFGQFSGQSHQNRFGNDDEKPEYMQSLSSSFQYQEPQPQSGSFGVETPEGNELISKNVRNAITKNSLADNATKAVSMASNFPPGATPYAPPVDSAYSQNYGTSHVPAMGPSGGGGVGKPLNKPSSPPYQFTDDDGEKLSPGFHASKGTADSVTGIEPELNSRSVPPLNLRSPTNVLPPSPPSPKPFSVSPPLPKPERVSVAEKLSRVEPEITFLDDELELDELDDELSVEPEVARVNINQNQNSPSPPKPFAIKPPTASPYKSIGEKIKDKTDAESSLDLEIVDEKGEVPGVKEVVNVKEEVKESQQSNVELEQIKIERDKLIDERRKLNKTITDLNTELEKAPKKEELDALKKEVKELSDKLTERESRLEVTLKEKENLESTVEGAARALNERVMNLLQKEGMASDLVQQVEGLVKLYEQEHQKLENLNEGEEKLKSQREAAFAEMKELKRSVESKVSRIKELAEENEKIHAKLSESNRRFDTYAKEAASLKEEAERLKASNEELKKTLDTRPNQLEFQEICDELEQTRATLHKMRDERDSLSKERNEILTKVDEFNLRNTEVEGKMRQLTARIDVLVTERDTLKQEKTAFARETDYLQIERKRLQDETTKLREDLREAGKTSRKHKRVFDELSADLRQLVAQNQRLTEELKVAESRAPNQTKFDELTDELQFLRDTNLELREEVSAVTRDLGTVSQERNGLLAKIESLQGELDSLHVSMQSSESIQGQLVELKQKVRQDDDLISDLQHHVETLQTKLSLAHQEIAGKNQDIARLEAENDDLKSLSGGDESGNKLLTLKNQLAEAERKLFEVIIEKDKLEDRLAELEKK